MAPPKRPTRAVSASLSEAAGSPQSLTSLPFRAGTASTATMGEDDLMEDTGPDGETPAAASRDRKLGLPIVESAFNMPHPASTRRAQRSRAEAPDVALKREEERKRRWREYGFAVDDFDRATERPRMWFKHSQDQKFVWDNERARLGDVIPRLQEELAKAFKDLENMKEAEAKLEEDHGEEIENGCVNEETLEGYRAFLKLEHDREPFELVDSDDGF